MKARINRDEHAVAICFNKLGCWSFFPVTKKGRLSKRRKDYSAFEPSFTKALTDVRAQGYKLSHKGWRKLRFKKNQFDSMKHAVESIWNQKAK